MTNKKRGFRLSFPTILLLIAALLYGILRLLSSTPQHDFRNFHYSECGITEFNFVEIDVGCNPSIYQTLILITLELILFGPSLIVSKIFSNGIISVDWMRTSIFFSFFVYYLIDYLIKIISKKRKKYSDKSESFK